jgi:hypothetical protein
MLKVQWSRALSLVCEVALIVKIERERERKRFEFTSLVMDNNWKCSPIGMSNWFESILVYCSSLQAPIYLQLKVDMSNLVT